MSEGLSLIPMRRDGRITLVVVLHKPGMERLHRADPADFRLGKMMGLMGLDPCTHSHAIEIVICYEEDETKIVELVAATKEDSSGEELMKYLRRGYTVTPEDHLHPDNLTELLRRAAAGGQTH